MHLIAFPMGTLLSACAARVRELHVRYRKFILPFFFGVLILGGSLGLSAQVTAQTTPYVGPTGYDSANAIEKGLTATGNKASGVLADSVNATAEAIGRFIANILLLFARLFLHLASFFIDFIMVLAGYNGYLDSTAVNVGWTVVRDITNMLFIIILLVIAFATILGLEGYEWKQLLPKLVTAAILVNFSRTICGLLIDASQVVMITFLNAVSATIGGNIINAFRLPSFEAFHPAVQGQQLTSPGIISAAALAFAFSAVVMAVIGAYVFILLGRLIRLWVLIVLSPMAFVLGVLPSTSTFSSQWWSELLDNLITGPVIMFFIWLSLIVVGSGQTNQELIRGSRLADKSPIEQAFGPQEQTATITDIGGWNNLANFVVAVGMLLAGAKVASSIGGSSGNLLEAGLNFGKKVALAGLGYGLIRRFGGGAASTAQGLLGRGASAAFGRVTAPFRRGAQILGARSSAYFANQEAAGNIKAKEAEDRVAELRKAGKLNPLQSARGALTSWWYSSEGRKNKNVSNWQDIAKLAQTRVEESYGVSGKVAGIRKARDTQLTNQIINEGKIGKEKKEAEVALAFSDGVKYITDSLSPHQKAIVTAQNDLEAAKKAGITLNIEAAQADLAKAQKDLEDTKINLLNPEHPNSLKKRFQGNAKVEPGYLWDYYTRGNKQVKTEADVKELQHVIHNSSELALARQRDQILINEGKPPIFEAEERERQIKERRDLLSKFGYETTVAQIGELGRSLAQNRTGLLTATGSQKHHLEEQIKEQVQAMADLQSSNAARGAGFSTGGVYASNQGAGIPPLDIDASNVAGQQAKELSAILGRQVAATNIEVQKAFDEFKEIKGEEFQAFMASYVDSLNAAAGSGAINKAGLFRGDWNKATRRVEYTLANQASANEKRGYALNQSRASLTKLEGFGDSLDTIGGKVQIVSPEAINRVVSLLANRTKEQISHIHPNLTASLKNAFSNISTANARLIKDQIINATTDTKNKIAVTDYVDNDLA